MLKIEEQRLQAMPVVKEELGGGYFYRCPWINCNEIIRSDWSYCPYCGQALMFENDNYTREYYGGRT